MRTRPSACARPPPNSSHDSAKPLHHVATRSRDYLGIDRGARTARRNRHVLHGSQFPRPNIRCVYTTRSAGYAPERCPRPRSRASAPRSWSYDWAWVPVRPMSLQVPARGGHVQTVANEKVPLQDNRTTERHILPICYSSTPDAPPASRPYPANVRARYIHSEPSIRDRHA